MSRGNRHRCAWWWGLPLVLLVASVGLSSPAHAEGVDSTAHFHTVPGTMRLSHVSLSPVEPRYRWLVGLRYQYSRAPLTGEDADLVGTRNLLSDQHLGEILIIVGLPRVDVGLVFPFVVHQQGEPWTGSDGQPHDAVASAAAGDLRLHSKVNFVDPRHYDVGFAAAFGLRLPTGQVDRWAGSPGVVLTGHLVLDYWVGRVASFALNVGYVFRSKTERLEAIEIDDAFELAGGFRINFAEFGLPFVLWAEIVASTQIHDFFGSAEVSPVEGRFGARIWNTQNFFIELGWGVAINRGAGLSRYRVMVDIGLSFDTPWRSSRTPPPKDRDGDGIADAHDRCPDRAEDYDQFEDADGCPEPGKPTIPAAEREKYRRGKPANWWQRWREKHKRRMRENERKRKQRAARKRRERAARKHRNRARLPDLGPQRREIDQRVKRLGKTVKKIDRRLKKGTRAVKGSVKGIKRALPRTPPRRREPPADTP